MTIATVNGTEITREELDAQIAQLSQNPNIPTPEKTDEESYKKFEEMVAQQLVNDALIFAAAKDKGYDVKDEDVEKEFDAIVAKFPDADTFKKQLEAMSLTEESLKNTISRQRTIDQYYKEIFEGQDLTATDEEAQKLYDAHLKDKEGVPEFDKIKEQIKMELGQQKMQQYLGTVIQELRKGAEINISL
ncbi:MAG: SurA N-terminal domain-containing protein [Patescibacteria group bacterium UBA2103]